MVVRLSETTKYRHGQPNIRLLKTLVVRTDNHIFADTITSMITPGIMLGSRTPRRSLATRRTVSLACLPVVTVARACEVVIQ